MHKGTFSACPEGATAGSQAVLSESGAMPGTRVASNPWHPAMLVVLGLLTASCSHAAQPQAAPDAAWDAVFTRTEGWTGGDVAATVDLGDGRTLWLFGDSLIGRVEGGKHAAGTQMVNNAVAVHATPPAGSGRAPPADAVRFHWGQPAPDGKAAAWIIPDPARVKAHGDESAEKGANGWYWPAGGGCVVPGQGGKDRLILFLWHIGRRAGDHGIWGFKNVGGAVAVVENFREPVEKWRARQSANPHVVTADAAKADPVRRETNWGSAARLERSGESAGAGYLYIYGIREAGPLNKQLLVARAPAASIEPFDTWRFYTARGEWSPQAAEAAPIADGLTSELSVERLKTGGRDLLVMVQSEPVFGRRILVRTAPRPEGPWTRAAPVYEVAGVAKNKTYFTYAAKGHAPLAREGELLITYVINSHDFWAMLGDAQIYRPRFVRLPLSEMGSP